MVRLVFVRFVADWEQFAVSENGLMGGHIRPGTCTRRKRALQ